MIAADCNGDGRVDIADGITLVQFLFCAKVPPQCLAPCDANGDLRVDIADPVRVFKYLYLHGDDPVLPGCPDPADVECQKRVAGLYQSCAQSKGNVKIAWNPVLDDEGVAVPWYRVYLGSISKNYEWSFVVSGPSAFISGLLPGRLYFLAVTAVDARGLESDLSEEVSLQVSSQ